MLQQQRSGGLAALLLLAMVATGTGHTPQLRRQRTTTTAQDEALALQGYAAEVLAAQAAQVAAGAAPVLGAEPQDAATPDAAAAALVAAAAAPACTAPQFEWPAGSGYCWFKRNSNGVKQGPGSNVFSPLNVWVNAADQLVLTINYTKAPGNCGEVFANRSMGYGDYIVVTQTDPTLIDYRLVASPFLYADDTREYDMEYARWNVKSDPNNSQYVVQPYTTNAPVRFRVATTNVTHRIRWTPEAVSFESWLPASKGSGIINSWTYTGVNNFVPGDERMHFNYWIQTKATGLPSTSQFIASCFKFCPQANLAICSSALGTKPLCSASKLW